MGGGQGTACNAGVDVIGLPRVVGPRATAAQPAHGCVGTHMRCLLAVVAVVVRASLMSCDVASLLAAWAAGGAFGIANSTVSKDVGLGAQRQIQFSLRLNF